MTGIVLSVTKTKKIQKATGRQDQLFLFWSLLMESE